MQRVMKKSKEIYNSAQLIALIQELGFLPLLDSGIAGYSAEELVSDDCRYVVFPDGGWDIFEPYCPMLLNVR